MRTVHVATDAAGNIPDSDLNAVCDEMSGTARAICLWHGWLTDAPAANKWFAGWEAGLGSRFDDTTLLICGHWPSAPSDKGGIANALGEFSYFEMESRARLIGRTAGHRIAATVIGSGGTNPLQFICAGHSFGGIVATNQLAAVADDGESIPGDTFGLVLIQGACPNNYLESGQPGGPVQRLNPVVKVTKSAYDLALGCAYPFAELLEWKDRPAMGHSGPSRETESVFGGLLEVLDLSPWHATHTGIEIDPVFDFVAK